MDAKRSSLGRKYPIELPSSLESSLKPMPARAAVKLGSLISVPSNIMRGWKLGSQCVMTMLCDTHLLSASHLLYRHLGTFLSTRSGPRKFDKRSARAKSTRHTRRVGRSSERLDFVSNAISKAFDNSSISGLYLVRSCVSLVVVA